jgi:hypothetical protein
MGRRAPHADSRDVREHKYKPPIDRECGLYLRSLTSWQAVFGGPSNDLFFVIFVVKDLKTPFVSVYFVPPVRPFPPSPPLAQTAGRLT